MSRARIRETRRVAAPLFVLGTLLFLWGWIGNDVLIQHESKKPSIAKGSRVNGYLVNGKRLRIRGPNYESYSRVLSTLGRTCVHDRVRAALVSAYHKVYEEEPTLLFVFGETGWCGGGGFWPHRTHQNGLSVDFMVPVRRNGRIETLPSTVFDLFGYGNEFDEKGRLGEYEIDWDAMVLHLEKLEEAADENGLEIERVIFDPKLQPHLKEAKRGKRILRRLEFTDKPVWTRHDDHYHVDFVVTEKALKSERVAAQEAREEKREKKRK